MTHQQPRPSEVCIVPPREVITALENLYIVSSTLAQHGTYAQEIRDFQWRTMVQRSLEAKAALDRHSGRRETHGVVLLRQMAQLCERLVDQHAAGREIPFAVWREVDRFGREAYEWINLTAARRRGADA